MVCSVSHELFSESLDKLKVLLHPTLSIKSQTMSFMLELNLCAVDIQYSARVKFTYYWADGVVSSWSDHILTLQHHSNVSKDEYGVQSLCNFHNYHVPLWIIDKTDSRPEKLNSLSYHPQSSGTIDWSRSLLYSEMERYTELAHDNLPTLSTEWLSVVECIVPRTLKTLRSI